MGRLGNIVSTLALALPGLMVGFAPTFVINPGFGNGYNSLVTIGTTPTADEAITDISDLLKRAPSDKKSKLENHIFALSAIARWESAFALGLGFGCFYALTQPLYMRASTHFGNSVAFLTVFYCHAHHCGMHILQGEAPFVVEGPALTFMCDTLFFVTLTFFTLNSLGFFFAVTASDDPKKEKRK